MNPPPTDKGVDNAIITGVIARCIVDPAFLEAFHDSPERALAPYDLPTKTRAELLELDVAALRRFAGFITKVQHSYLLSWFPRTHQLLRSHGFELSAYSAYRAQHQALRAARTRTSRSDHARAFLGFLFKYLSDSCPPDDRLILVNTLRHERFIWEANEWLLTLPERSPIDRDTEVLPQHMTRSEFLASSAEVIGWLALAEYPVDPVAMLTGAGGSLGDDEPSRPFYCGYWSNPKARRVEILELSPTPACILANIDGRASVLDIVRRLSTVLEDETIAFQRVLEVLQTGISFGLLCLCRNEPQQLQ